MSAPTSTRRLDVWGRLGLPGLVVVGLVFLVPIGQLLLSSVTDPTPGLQNFQEVLTTEGYLRITLKTIGVAAVSTLLSLVIGYPIAYIIVTHRHAWFRQILLYAVVGSQMSSVLSRTFAWQVILGEEGPLAKVIGRGLLFTSAATTIGLVQYLLPFMILPLVTVMQRVNHDTVASAPSLGAGPALGFVRVFVPLTVAGIGMGTVMVFVYGVGSYATPAILGGRSGMMVGVVIQQSIDALAAYGIAAALAVILLLTVGIALLLYRVLLAGRLDWLLAPGQDVAAPSSDSARPASAAFHRIMRGPDRLVTRALVALDRSGASRWRWPHELLGAVVIIFLLAPQLIAVVISFSGSRSLVFPPRSYSTQWYANFFTEDWLIPAGTSLLVAVAASLLATALACFAAIAVARSQTAWVRTAVVVAMLLPLMVPGVVSAAAYYVAFLPLGLTDSLPGMVLAHMTILLPFAFGVILANVQSISANPERAAASLGASPLKVIRRVLLPQVGSGLVTAFCLGVLLSFDEAVIGIFLSGLHVKTLPARMFEAISKESDPTIGVINTLMMMLLVMAFGLFRLVTKRKGTTR